MQYLSDPETYQPKEAAYINVRSKEGRVYSDDLLLKLPDVPANHQYATEWSYRKQSAHDLIKYLQTKYQGKAISILDIGCGNGWMSHLLYKAGHTVAGIDLNKTELEQAEKVFGSNEKLQWIYADVMKDEFPVKNVDVVLMAASCQYFPDLNALTLRLASMLKEDGEIHLLDSMFYTDEEQQNARQRTHDYYNSMGHPEMSNYYYHHTRKSLLDLHYRQAKKHSLLDKILLKKKPALEWWIWEK